MDILVLGVVFFILLCLAIGVIISRVSKSGKLEEELKEERELTHAIVASIGEGVLVLDTDYHIKLINPQAEKLLETTAKEAVGQKWAEFVKAYVGENEITFEKRSSVKTLATGEIKVTSIGDDHYYFTRSGRKFPIVAITSALKKEGKVIGVVKVFRDATHEKEIDRMKTDFISLASHQLRTPLSAIKWFTELLLDPAAGTLTMEQQGYAAKIAVSTDRMVSLVNSLLNISRIESGRIMIDPKPTNLLELVESVISELKRKMDTKGHKFIINTIDKLAPVSVDPKLIGHVYANLIDNAIKYTQDKGEISVFISRKNDQIISQITDSGFGIPVNEQQKLFQRFFRASNAIKHVTQGSGLGLYLVKAIIESSGGKIWFKSEEGKGSTFWFSLPTTGMQPKKGEVSLDS